MKTNEAVRDRILRLCQEHDMTINRLAQGAGQGLFQQVQIHLLLLLGQQAQRRVHIGDDLAAAADIAAVYLADGGAVRLEPPPQLV